MTDAPSSRKTHVIRILGTNKNGDVLPDIWADVERMDVAHTVKENGDWQGLVRKMRWGDDPDGEGGVVEPRTRDGITVGSGSRDVVLVKVCSPDEPDLSDPQEWIPIDAIKTARLRRSDQGNVKNFINQEATEARIVEKRRVFHRDTTIDDQAQAAFDSDPTRKVFVVPGDQYSFVDGSDDKDQFVEHEVVTALKHRHNGGIGDSEGIYQGKQTKLLNQYIIDQTDEAKLEVVGANGFNPPYRLDPYQSIVNVNLSKFYPKYGAAYGFNGDLGAYVFFDVNEDGALITRFTASEPFDGSGYQRQGSSFVSSFDGRHSEAGEVVGVPVTSATINWKGISKIGGLISLFDEGLSLGDDVATTYNEVEYLNLDGGGSSPTEFNDVPLKGVAKGGFWVTNQSVAAYNGDALLWKLTGDIYEILPGGKVLGFLDELDFAYGIATISADGAITDFLSIPVGDTVNGGIDTSSNGDTFSINNNFDGDFPSGASTISRTDKNNAKIWTVTYGPTEGDDYTGPNSFRRHLAVIENNKRVFVMITDIDPASYGDHDDTHSLPPDTDMYLVILDGVSGGEVYREKWVTFIQDYCAEAGAAWCQTTQIGTPQTINGVVSSTRYPAPHA